MLKSFTPLNDVADAAAANRLKRLNKPRHNAWMGMLNDLIFGALPWAGGSAIFALVISALIENDSDLKVKFKLLNSTTALTAISGFVGFLLVSRQSAALGNNARVIGEFGNASGSCINLCLFIKSMGVSASARGNDIEYITLPDGKGGTYTTTRPALVCSSIMGVLKYAGRGVSIRPEGLALSQDPRLLQTFRAYIAKKNDQPGLSPFAALILILGELVDVFQTGERASEYSVIFKQINAITAAEGAISGTNGYSGPYIMTYLLTILYSLYLGLLIATELAPDNGYNSVWISAIVAFSTIGFMQIAVRYANPTKVRTKAINGISGQKPLISYTVADTEVTLNSIFARGPRFRSECSSNALGDASAVQTGMSFTLVGARH